MSQDQKSEVIFHKTDKLFVTSIAYWATIEMEDQIKKLWTHLKSLESIGIHPDISYLDSKKIKMLNLIAWTCVPFTFFFSLMNWHDGKYFLSIINASNFIASVSVLILHHYRLYTGAKLTLTFGNFLFFFLGGFFFSNGGEYFLLSTLIVILQVYDQKWVQISSGIVILTAMFIVIFYPSPLFAEQQVPSFRIIFNFVGAVSFIITVVVFFKNIQLSYQDKIEEQHAKLKEMNSTMESIFSIVAHDIRSPLASVQYMLFLFQKDIITEQYVKENVTVINNKLSHLNAALDNLLQWGSRNIHGLHAYRKNVSIAEIIEEVFQLLAPQINQKEIKLKKDIDNTLISYVYRDQITVVLRNIISNAIKYSFFGESIFISAKETLGYAAIEIKDKGTGIKKDKLNSLFNNVQIPASRTDGERGSGLGLLLCKELLIQNGGTFRIESQTDVGSTFIISLPIKKHKQKHDLVELN